MSLEIREITTDKELYEVGKLRYEVTVEEMKLNMVYADHVAKTVIEPLDSSGHIFAAWSDGTLVGCLRTNILGESNIGHYFESYDISTVLERALPNEISITTRMVIKRSHRKGTLSLLLPNAAYQFFLNNSIQYDIIDSRKRLVGYFEKMGYLPHLPDWDHPEFGQVVVQYLSVRNEAHLRQVNSPFLPLHKKHFEGAAHKYRNFQSAVQS